jgi:hypothetical protein
MPSNPAPAPGDELAALARRYRHEAVATLIAVQRDPRAPASARAQAATKLLEYADGRPAQAKPITVADLPSMTHDQRNELLSALIFQYEAEMPGEFKRLLQDITDEAMDQLMSHMAAAPPPRLPYQPREPLARRMITRPGQCEQREIKEPQPPPPPDNVIPLSPARPLPRGTHPPIPSTISPQDAAHERNTAVPAGGVHPDVLYRSTLPSHLALDNAHWRSR